MNKNSSRTVECSMGKRMNLPIHHLLSLFSSDLMCINDGNDHDPIPYHIIEG